MLRLQEHVFPYMLRLQEHMFPYMLRARVKKLLDGDEEQETLLQFIDSAMKRPDSKQVLEVRQQVHVRPPCRCVVDRKQVLLRPL